LALESPCCLRGAFTLAATLMAIKPDEMPYARTCLIAPRV
jgi:hypothetical protein